MPSSLNLNRTVLHLTASEERQMSELVSDVARTSGSNWRAVLEKKEIHVILEAQNLSGGEKTRRILEILRAICFPHLSRCEAEWKVELDRLGRPKDIWIPLTKALELSCLDEALESSRERRAAGLKWIEDHKEDLRSFLNRITNTVRTDGGKSKSIPR